MISPEAFYHTLTANGVDFFCGVPDSLLQNLCAYLTDHCPKANHIITANEGAATALACGHHMATGHIPVVYMQNSGIGNAVNPLLSLADEKVYRIPLLLVVGWRGEPGVKDEPQHVKQGLVSRELFDAMQVPYAVLDTDQEKALEQVRQMIDAARQTEKPHAILIRKDTFDKYKLQNKAVNNFGLTREEAMQLVAQHLGDDPIVVSTTGKLSRELFEYRESTHQGHAMDFLTVGSMGHSSSIALGIALARPLRRVVCFDGDGAMIMHMGALSNIGDARPANFLHILFNNGAHESVGGQPTVGFSIDFLQIALANGYRQAVSAQTAEEITAQLDALTQCEGPSLLEIKVNRNSRPDLGRPTTTPVDNKLNFMDYVAK